MHLYHRNLASILEFKLNIFNVATRIAYFQKGYSDTLCTEMYAWKRFLGWCRCRVNISSGTVYSESGNFSRKTILGNEGKIKKLVFLHTLYLHSLLSYDVLSAGTMEPVKSLKCWFV